VAPVTKPAARAHPEGRQHLRERAAATVEHDADAHHADAHTKRTRLPGFALPGRAQIVSEAGVGGVSSLIGRSPCSP